MAILKLLSFSWVGMVWMITLLHTSWECGAGEKPFFCLSAYIQQGTSQVRFKNFTVDVWKLHR
jgi:hypothetical protein